MERSLDRVAAPLGDEPLNKRTASVERSLDRLAAPLGDEPLGEPLLSAMCVACSIIGAVTAPTVRRWRAATLLCRLSSCHDANDQAAMMPMTKRP